MGSPKPRPATYEDLLRLPESMTGQIVDGELYAMPRPGAPHLLVTSNLGGELNVRFQRGMGGPGGWWILDEPELHLGANVLVPDLAGWRIEEMPQFPLDKQFFELRPNWVCEVLSPSTASLDRVKKRRLYESAGVQWLWFIDPVGRTVDAYELRSGSYALLGMWGPGEAPQIPPFEAINLELDAIWGTSAH
jgi:Uma2 family endonuclease